MGIVFVPFYIKYLGIEAYGLIGLFAVLQAWLGLLDLGMSPTLNREMARLTAGAHTADTAATSILDILRSIEVVAIVIALLITATSCMASEWIAKEWLRAEKLSIETIAQTLSIMGFVTAIRFVESIYRSALLGLQRQVLYNFVNSILATLRGLGAVGVLMWWSPTIEAFFIWQSLVSILSVLILSAITYNSLPQAERTGRFSLSALREISEFAGGMTAIAFLSTLLMQVDKLLLSKLLNLIDYGHYMLASTVAGVIYILINPIGQTWAPKLVELHYAKRKEEFVNKYHLGCQIVSVVVGNATFILIAFSEFILLLWTQSSEISSRNAQLVAILAIGNMLNCFMWIPYQTQLAYGWTSLAIWVNIISVSIIVPAIILVSPIYGAEGASLVWVGLNAGYVLIGIHFMYRKILTQEKWRWYIQDLLLPLCPVILIIGISSLLMPTSMMTVSKFLWIFVTGMISLSASALIAPAVRVTLLQHLGVNIKVII